MADQTRIEWTNATWTPVKGCTRASEGCRNCYAEIMAARFSKPGQWGHGLATIVETPQGKDHRWTGKVKLDETELLTPLRWRKPRKVFVCSTADLFHESVPDEWIDRVFAVMALAPQHTFQVLTKRSARMRDYMLTPGRAGIIQTVVDNWECADDCPFGDVHAPWVIDPWPLPNVWLGVSVEDQARADERIPDLLATPAAVRWLSCEPLLGPVDLTNIQARGGDFQFNAFERQDHTGARINWIVAGGESGPGARPMHPEWARALRDQCAKAGVPFFFKQWGSWAPVCAMSEEAIDDAYHPAPARDPEATRRPKVDLCVLHRDGRRFAGPAMFERAAFEQGSAAMTMFHIGKKAAGRLLDSVLHDGMPATSPSPTGARP